ncbi:MAG TPA: AzlD domain-containing protein [Actinomycetota bacterium]|nr:AzlD domain-containing protein [Actinomycetota bacterium]
MLVALVSGSAMLLKAIGPAFIGGRRLPPWLSSSADLLARFVLAALVVTQTFSEGTRLVVDARAAGLAAAAVAVALRAPVIVVLLIAVATTASVRLLT